MVRKYMWCLLVSLMIMTVAFSKDVIDTIKSSLDLCIYTLIPSLFPFLVLSRMMILSNSAEHVGKILHPITGRIFGLSENGSFLFVLGIICGYPVGAKCISDMYKNKKISLKEAERLLLFSNNSGPLFVIGSIGYGMYSDIRIGGFLYLSHILSAIVIGLITRKNNAKKSAIGPVSYKPFFTQSVEDSMISVINISGYVIFFSAICAIINRLLPTELNVLKYALCSLMEITGGIKTISYTYSLTPQIKLLITSFLVGFGGICVFFQTKSALSDSGLSIIPCLYAKICQGALSVFFTYMMMNAHPLRSCAHIKQPNISLSNYMLFASLVLIVIYFLKLRKRSNKTCRY